MMWDFRHEQTKFTRPTLLTITCGRLNNYCVFARHIRPNEGNLGACPNRRKAAGQKLLE